MNTFGIKRKVHTFGLGLPTLVKAYHEIQRFALAVAKAFRIGVGQ